ncbi:MAG: phosphonopyruvate decarboxylase [Brevinema sp.]
MINISELFEVFNKQGIKSFYGVPDSLLKSFCAYLADHTDSKNHIIAANEGNAIALACGNYLATGNPAVVYLQNSGIGNCVNPLLSLSDEEVYCIPFLMIIGWRGEPGIKDEPQHIKQGKISDKLLETMGIEYSILPQNQANAEQAILHAISYMKNTQKPYAFLVQKDTFEEYKLQKKIVSGYALPREEAIACVTSFLSDDTIVVATTGHISRELYEYRQKENQGHSKDFLMVGSMGHASSIALGIALKKPTRLVMCFDGDGASLMHMGAFPVIAAQNLPNLKHIIFNNEAHDSVGGQPTCANTINFPETALASGYKNAYSVDNIEDLTKIMPEFLASKQTSLLEVKVKCGARKDLGRPKEKPVENKALFMKFLS